MYFKLAAQNRRIVNKIPKILISSLKHSVSGIVSDRYWVLKFSCKSSSTFYWPCVLFECADYVASCTKVLQMTGVFVWTRKRNAEEKLTSRKLFLNTPRGQKVKPWTSTLWPRFQFERLCNVDVLKFACSTKLAQIIAYLYKFMRNMIHSIDPLQYLVNDQETGFPHGTGFVC